MTISFDLHASEAVVWVFLGFHVISCSIVHQEHSGEEEGQVFPITADLFARFMSSALMQNQTNSSKQNDFFVAIPEAKKC